MDQEAARFPKVDESSGEASVSSGPSVYQVKKLLFGKMRVGVSDGRIFTGLFHCLDKQGNIILQDAVEYLSSRRASSSPIMKQRSLGLILIPASRRTSCHVPVQFRSRRS